MRTLLTIVILSQAILSFGKDRDKNKGKTVDTVLVQAEQDIEKILTNLRNTDDDGEKDLYNTQLQTSLEKILTRPAVMDHDFDTWTTMSTITSPDGAFRIFNWNVEDKNLTHSHFCYVVKPARSATKDNKVFKFKEDKFELPPRPTQTLMPNKWYGALYYKIIPVQKGNKTYYTMLGFSGEDRSTNQKLIDVFYFKGKHLRMGAPIFQEAKGSKRLVRRVFFQYSEKAIMSVNQNEKLDGIVFDHLVPEQPQLEGMYSFYIPDMTYDAYRWDGTVWKYNEDVIAYNDDYSSYRAWRPTEDGDSSTYELDGNFWINPVDPNSPVGGGVDATAPVEDLRDEKEQKKANRKKKDGRRKFKLFSRKKKKKPRSAIGAD